ncbi:helix-turn-helix transcriptional regulator [Leucobacter albus]|uniref:LuxR C-terminal-related transcriptional regulator n=1 Tax=Leucobacter albus TaxID=272210 RepID=A0ABW3TPF5_9MICO
MSRRSYVQQVIEKSQQQNGMLFVVDGEAGMGKTILLRALVDAGDEAKWNTTFVRADEIEQLEPYSFIERLTASNLFPDWYFIPDANTTPVDLARECVQRLTAESRDRGNVIVIDDAQWIDEASQRVLRYVIPRVIRRGTFLAFGARAPHVPGSFGEFLVTLCGDSSRDAAHHLKALTPLEISGLVLERHGAMISAQSAQRILDATGGTFLGVDSVLAAMSDREVSQLHLSWETDIKIDLPTDALVHSFRQLDPAARRTAELVCLAGHELTLQQLRLAASLLGEPVQYERAIDANVLAHSGHDEVILPRHALLAEAIADTVSAERARQVFRALAETTSGHRSIRHRIRGAESWNDELHEFVDSYVHDEASQGRLVNASEALREALARAELPEARAKLLADLALLHMEAKTSYLVLDILDELETLPKDMLHEMLCVVLAAHRVGAESPQERMQRLLMMHPKNADELVVLSYFAFMVVILTMRSPDTSGVAQIIALAKGLAAQLPADPATVANPRLRWMVDPVAQAVVLDCYLLVGAQRIADAETVKSSLPDLVARAEQLPESALKVDALVAIAGSEVSIGDLAAARNHAQQSVDMIDRVPEPWAAGTARVILVDCMILQGDYQAANDYLSLLEEFSFTTMDVEMRPALAALRARLAAITQEGDWVAHAEHARRQRDFVWEAYEPALNLITDCEVSRVTGDVTGVLVASEGEWVERLENTRHGFLTYRAHALIDAGELDEAATLIEQLAAWRGTRWLEYWGSLDWLQARLVQARGDHDTALWHYAAAIENEPYPLQLGLCRADYGELLHVMGQRDEASHQLSLAVRGLEEIGALGYVPQVRNRLASMGVPEANQIDDAALDLLTDRERQIVAHLAKGRSNNQIAESLVVSVATVRTHVSNVLRKLGLSSRGEVAKLHYDYAPGGVRKLEA